MESQTTPPDASDHAAVINPVEHAIMVIANNTWELYKACVCGHTKHQKDVSKWMTNPEEGNLVMEISAFRRDVTRGIGHLLSVKDEWIWFTDDDGNEIERPEGTPRITYEMSQADELLEHNGYYERFWTIKCLLDGSEQRWHNCEFIRIFDKDEKAPI